LDFKEKRVKNETTFEPTIDLLEIRRQLIAMRSLHSDNRRITNRINKLIGEIAHLREPYDRAHEKHLIRMIAKTARAVERIISSDQPAAQTGRKPWMEVLRRLEQLGKGKGESIDSRVFGKCLWQSKI
jgi:hypothetical protein